jgi:hypothetical protein
VLGSGDDTLAVRALPRHVDPGIGQRDVDVPRSGFRISGRPARQRRHSQPVVLSFRSLKRPDLGLQSVNLRLLLLDLCLLLLHGFHQERSEPGVVDPARVLAVVFIP